MTTNISLFSQDGCAVQFFAVDIDIDGALTQSTDVICNTPDERIAAFIAEACNAYQPNKRQKKRAA